MPPSNALPGRRAFALDFRDLVRWDIKTAKAIRFKKDFPNFQPLAAFAEEATETVRPFDKPETYWPVYGVNNETGVFLSDTRKGSAFNSPYKRIRRGWFFHNPTRANVGSLGRVPEVPENAITSPEYQVWRIRSGLIPEFLEVIFKMPFFMEQVEFHRVGAVKERLFVQNLLEILIPPHSQAKQEKIVSCWQKAQDAAVKFRERIDAIEKGIPGMVYQALGTSVPKPGVALPRMMTLPWKDLERWSFNYLARLKQGLLGFTAARYPIHPLEQFVKDTANGFCIRPVQTPTPYKMLKLNALTPDGLDVEQTKFVDVPASVAEHFRIRRGDLLICRSVGSYDHIAKCVLVDRDWDNILFPDIIIKVVLAEALLPEYVREVIQTPLGRSFFQSSARTAVGMWKIGADDIRSFPIPVPPLDVQQQIVQSVSRQRQQIAEEKMAGQRNLDQATREVEEMILGVRPVS